MKSVEIVDLGFTEFVGKLIEETYNSILNSQLIQIEKYQEIKDFSSISLERFIRDRIDENDLLLIEKELLGEKLEMGMHISEALSIRILDFIEVFDAEIDFNGELCSTTYSLIRRALQELLYIRTVQKYKDILERSEIPKIFVTEGEITAKVSLSSVSEKGMSKKKNKKEKFNFIKIAHPSNKSKNIMLVDRTNLKASDLVEQFSLPRTRIIASTPNENSVAESINAEIRIKFKSL